MEKVFTEGVEKSESLKQKAKSSCRKCHGLGSLGKDIIKDEEIPCSCTKKKKSLPYV